MTSQSANLWVLLSLSVAGIVFFTRKLRKTVKQDFGAFISKFQLCPPPPPLPPKAPHPLNGLTFAVADVFDIDGHVTTFGHPDWASTHEAPSRTSPVISALVDGGATCVGTTVVDELAYGFSGENKYYGTPTNPVDPARVPGGSSSGAAVAVAAGLVDFSLGIDTVGGVRIPAAFCDVIGFRPSHGIVSSVGVIPVSNSMDTVGLFAKDPSILRKVGHILLQVPFALQRNPRQMIIADDCFQDIKFPIDSISQAVNKSIEKLFGRQVLRHVQLQEYFASVVPSLKEFNKKKVNGKLKTPMEELVNVMKLLHRNEFTHNHGEWIDSVKAAADSTVSMQLHEKLEGADVEIEKCKSIRNEMRLAISSLLKDDGILVIPTIAYPPSKLGAKEIQSESYQNCAFSLLSVSSISGGCQVSLPLGVSNRFPVSISFIARHGGDRFLLDTVHTMYSTLREQTDIKTKVPRNAISQEESAEIAKEQGNQAFKDKQWHKAIGCYSEAIKLSSKNATYYSNRAAAYLELGSYVQAEADCTKAISLDKKNVKAYLRRGTAREMLGYYKDAIDDFKYALVLEPTNKRASSSAERLRKLFL